jgi:hypothetical protein
VATGRSFVLNVLLQGELVGLSCDINGGQLFALHDVEGGLRIQSISVAKATDRKFAVLSSTNIPYENLSTLYVPPHSRDNLLLALDGKRHGLRNNTLTPDSAGFTRLEAEATYWLGELRELAWDWNNESLTGWQHETAKGVQRWHRRWLGQLWWKPKPWQGARAMDAFAPDASTLILAGVDDVGVLHRSELSIGSTSGSAVRTSGTRQPDDFTGAVVILKANLMAAVTRSNKIVGYRAVGKDLVSTWSIETFQTAPFHVAVSPCGRMTL